MLNAYGRERQIPRMVARRSQVAAVFPLLRGWEAGFLLRKLQRGDTLPMPHASAHALDRATVL